MGYTVFIPTAGTGSRLGGVTKYINKSLVGLGNRPAISRIIESFPEDTRFVIAVGYKGELVKEYLSLAHRDRQIQCVDVLLYEGEGSGLGLTLLTCKEHLQEPFIFCSCDTLVSNAVPAPDKNWMGYDSRDNKEQYRTINVDKQGYVQSIDEKGADGSASAYPYIGLAGIYDYKTFWAALEEGKEESVCIGEVYGLREILKSGRIEARNFTWFDTGVKVELQATRKRFETADSPNILEKYNEAIWFLGDRVIKFSDDPQFISDRVRRAKLLKGFVPEIVGHTTHMYCYNYVEGNVLSKCVSIPLFKRLLQYSASFWVQRRLEGQELRRFYDQCMGFYRDKTLKRVELFYETFQKNDNAEVINGRRYPKLSDILAVIDWEKAAKGLPGQFHGDFHFENILYNQTEDHFEFLDWRQNFGAYLDVGDIYYDLAKLKHGLIISHELIAKDLFSASWDGNEITFDFHRKQSLVECEAFFDCWIKENGYDLSKVNLLTALIFLNICALHEYPYVVLLYGLGKKMLYETIMAGGDGELISSSGALMERKCANK